MIFARDFNLIFDKNLKSAGESPFQKTLNGVLNFCAIWRVRNAHKKLFTFQQKHFTGIIRRRLDHIFVSNNLRESVKRIILPFSAPLLTMIGVWKFNNSLLFNTDFVKKLKSHVEIVKSILQGNSPFSDHSKWKFLKYEITQILHFFLKEFS